jgi:hypothetical protein
MRTSPPKPMCFGAKSQVTLDGRAMSSAVCKLCYWRQGCLRDQYKQTMEFKTLARERRRKK